MERKTPSRAACLFFLATLSPFLLGFWVAGREYLYTGLSGIGQADFFAYLASARQAQEGAWLLVNLYTPSSQTPSLFHPLFLAVGKTARWLNISLPWAVLLWKVLLAAPFLWVAWQWVQHFYEDQLEQTVAYLLLLFGSGLGGLAALLGFLKPTLGFYPSDLETAESNTFLTFLHGFPIYVIAQTLLIWGMLGLLKAERPLRKKASALLALFALSWVHPHDIVLFFGVASLFLGLTLLRRERWQATLLYLVMAALLCLPSLLHYLHNLAHHPDYLAFVRHPKQSAPPIAYLLGTAPFLLLALGSTREERASQLLCWSWLLVVPLLLYAPLPFQRSMIEGVHFPLAILAAGGLVRLLRRRERLIRIALIFLSFSNIVMMTTEWKLRIPPAYPFSLNQEWQSAFQSLAKQRGQEIVLSSYATGNLLPAFTGKPVFVGHWDLTLHFEEKRAEAEHFFQKPTEKFLADHSIGVVFYGPEERRLAPSFSPPVSMPETFHSNTISIFVTRF